MQFPKIKTLARRVTNFAIQTLQSNAPRIKIDFIFFSWETSEIIEHPHKMCNPKIKTLARRVANSTIKQDNRACSIQCSQNQGFFFFFSEIIEMPTKRKFAHTKYRNKKFVSERNCKGEPNQKDCIFVLGEGQGVHVQLTALNNFNFYEMLYGFFN